MVVGDQRRDRREANALVEMVAALLGFVKQVVLFRARR
jgi:hypothetical protein